MMAMASQITSLPIVYPTVYSCADKRKHQSSALLAICAGNSPVTGFGLLAYEVGNGMFIFTEIYGCISI